MASLQAREKQMERRLKEKEREKQMLNRRKEIRLSQQVKQPLFDEEKIDKPLVLSRQSDRLAVIVDPRLSTELQEHQREGVQKMYNVVSKYVRNLPGIQRAFILADKQGLGNTQNLSYRNV